MSRSRFRSGTGTWCARSTRRGWFRLRLAVADAGHGEGDGSHLSSHLKLDELLVVAQVDMLEMLETMTPLEFPSCRERLESGSGFQSCELRAVEFVLGHEQSAALGRYPEGSAHRARLAIRGEL